jgi:hypothetical protein
MLDYTVMEGLGMNKKCIRTVWIALLILGTNLRINAETIVLNTYDSEDSINFKIAAKLIDLDDKAILKSVILRDEGYIWNKIPFLQYTNNSIYYLTGIQSGGYAKNSIMDNEATYIFILNDSLNINRILEYRNSFINNFNQIVGNREFTLSITFIEDTAQVIDRGLFIIDDNLQLLKTSDSYQNINPFDILYLGSFQDLHRLNGNQNYIYYSLSDSGYILIKLDPSNTRIISTIPTAIHHSSAIFAYHSTRNKLYLFHLNYERHGKYKEYEKNYGDDWINPEVFIYDPESFTLIDHLPLADFSPGNYTLRERGQADIIGDYIVYYFFEDEWMGRFNPAMLFIFDTRTNEATWLRVGWR